MVAHVGQAGPPVRVIAARTVGYVLAVLALWDGVGLAIGGDQAVATPSWAVLRAFPGPVVMGLLFIAAGLVLLFALAVPGQLLAFVLAIGGFLYLTVAAMFVASWAVFGDFVWTAPSKNVAIAVFWLLVLRARPIAPTSEASQPGRR